MTKIELNAFRSALENEQAEIGDRRASRAALAIDTSPDEMDRIQQANERDYVVSNLERNASRARELRAALDRIDAGTFGICTRCEEKINPKRLAAIPWASACIVCQEASDREQKTPENKHEPLLVLAA